MFGSRITILMYHSISDEPDPYTVSPDAFERHLTFVRERYPVIRLKDVARHLDGRGERKVIITFDDAYVDFIEHAQEPLRRLGLPSTLFVPTALIGGWNSWDRHNRHVVRRRVMSLEQLREVAGDDLVDIGAHTVDHVCMRSVSDAEMLRQVTESRRFLEAEIGQPVTTFSYPYGQLRDFSKQSERALAAAGYQVGVTTCWGTRQPARHLLSLRRVSLGTTDRARTLAAKIEGGYDWIGLKSRAAFLLRAAAGRTAHTH